MPNTSAPATERVVRVTAHVQFLAAVQADVNEVGGDVFVLRPLVGGVGDYERDRVLAKQVDERRIDEAFVSHFERVAKRTAWTERKPRATRHRVVVAASDRGCGIGIVRQQGQKSLEKVWIVGKGPRELPEDWPELLAQVRDPGGQKIGERLLHLGEPPEVCDEARALDAEDEIRRRLGVPARVAFRALQRVERAVKLDRRKPARCVLELATLRQALRIERSAP